MNIPLDEVVHFDSITSTPGTGASVDADSAPTFAVYEEATDTAIVSGTMTKRTSLTGNYRGTFTASAANGFEVGKWYSVIATGIVGGATGKAVVLKFRLLAAEVVAGKPKVDADALAGQTITATAGVTFPVAIASQTSVDTIDDLLDTEITALTTAVADIPTNAELATALGTSDDAVIAAIAAEAVKTAATKVVTDKLDTALALDGSVYRFTANALELAPSGGGSGGSATLENQELILAKTNLIGTAAATQLVRQAASKITLYIGERHTFTINVNNDYTALTVTLCFETTDATTDIAVIANGSLTKTTSSVAFAIPEAVTTTDRNLRWSIRDASTKEVLEFGLAYVRPQSLADS